MRLIYLLFLALMISTSAGRVAAQQSRQATLYIDDVPNTNMQASSTESTIFPYGTDQPTTNMRPAQLIIAVTLAIR
jgi:hypothetical protein